MKCIIRPRTTSGFSLVELSIVLVILGLLVGGVLSGQALIRAAELRAVSTEYNRYFTAVQSFRDKYFAIPGDMNTATQFWGRMNGNADCVTNSSAAVSATAGACDGNGGGTIAAAAAASQSGEHAQFWRQLAFAGLIEGTYSGLAGSGGASHCVVGTDCPRSKLNNAGWGVRYVANSGGDTAAYAFDYQNFFVFGAQLATATPYGSVLKPEEAWNIDTKIDDGKPATGKIIAYNWDNCTTSTSNTDYAGTYDFSNSSIVCSIQFVKAF